MEVDEYSFLNSSQLSSGYLNFGLVMVHPFTVRVANFVLAYSSPWAKKTVQTLQDYQQFTRELKNMEIGHVNHDKSIPMRMSGVFAV